MARFSEKAAQLADDLERAARAAGKLGDSAGGGGGSAGGSGGAGVTFVTNVNMPGITGARGGTATTSNAVSLGTRSMSSNYSGAGNLNAGDVPDKFLAFLRQRGIYDIGKLSATMIRLFRMEFETLMAKMGVGINMRTGAGGG